MKKIIYTLLSLICSFLLFNNIHIAASNEHILKTYRMDITGDHLHEFVYLNGEALSKQSPFYRRIWLTIVTPYAKEWTVPLKSGYAPHITFIDINGDNINDILYSSKRDNDLDEFQYELFSIQHGDINKLTLPNERIISKYKDEFTASLTISPFTEDEQTIELNLNKYKNTYLKEDLYDDKGSLLKQAHLSISSPTHLTPVDIGPHKQSGIKSKSEVKDYKNKHVIGTIETIWTYEKSNWIALQSTWSEIEA